MEQGICQHCSTKNKTECSWEDHIIGHEYYVEEDVQEEVSLDWVKGRYSREGKMKNSDALLILLIDELKEKMDAIKQYALRIKENNDWLRQHAKRQKECTVIDYLSERLNEVISAEGDEW